MYWQFANNFIFNGTDISLTVPKLANAIIKGLVLYIFVFIFNFVLKEIMRLNKWQTAFGVLLLFMLVLLYFFQIIHNVYGYVNPLVIKILFAIILFIYTGIGVILCLKPPLIFGKKNENEFQEYVNDRLSKIESQIIAKNKEISEMNLSSRTDIFNSMFELQDESGKNKENTFAALQRAKDFVNGGRRRGEQLNKQQESYDSGNAKAGANTVASNIKEAGNVIKEIGNELADKMD